MAAVIDPRLREAETEQNLTENYNRLLAMVDALAGRVDDLSDKLRVPKLQLIEFEEMRLDPAFDADTLEYTGETDSNGEQITVETQHSGDTVTVASEDATISEEGAITWAEGENVVTITVTNGFFSTVYTVTVTYTPAEAQT